jgi:hypothetical protein
VPAYTWTRVLGSPVKATDFTFLSCNRMLPLDLRNMFSCPEATRTGYHEAVWFMHQMFLGGREVMDAFVDAIDNVVDHRQGLRGLDHKAIRNLRWSG